jgi:hypothetical protein
MFGAKLPAPNITPQQFGVRLDGLRLRNHVRGRMLAAGKVIAEQHLDLRHTVADR